MKRQDWRAVPGGLALGDTSVCIRVRQGDTGDLYQLLFEGRNHGVYWDLEFAQIDGLRLGGDTVQARERAAALM